MVLPLQLEPGLVAALIGRRVFERLNHRRRLTHVHLDSAQIPRCVVGRFPLSGLLVNDELPVVGVRQIDEEGIIALRHAEPADVGVGVDVEPGSRVRPRASHGIGIVFGDSPVFAEQLAFTTLHRRRGVIDDDRPGGDRDRNGLVGAFWGWSRSRCGNKRPGVCQESLQISFLLKAHPFNRAS